MQMNEARKIMDGFEVAEPPGFRVHFERVVGSMLESDYFPARNEPLIKTEDEAWFMAGKFAAKTFGRCVNIYVIDEHFAPVPNYQVGRITNRDVGNM